MPDEITGAELDRDVRSQLVSLGPYISKEVARHLVMAGQLLDEDPEAAWQHAEAARRRAGRIGVVREAAGLAAYRSGRYSDALAELRAARRLTGSNVHLPVMADCERGLGRPERALAMAWSDEAQSLDLDGQVEVLLVAAGARGDLGQLQAAVVTLQVPALHAQGRHAWLARLRCAYADALEALGRSEESRHWLELAAQADPGDESGAAERLAELDGIVLVDLLEDTAEDAAEVIAGDVEGDTAGGGAQDAGEGGAAPAGRGGAGE